ncbi:MAG TPA: nuclear transport factor 2 family protein [Gaiellaceae bacterium]|nr:nuclear transport factor 2 family protein [Gaiellaceae bacterium]
MSDHTATRVRAAVARFVGGDPAALLDLFADDATWEVPGDNAMAGVHRGRDGILAFLRRTAELTERTYHVEPLWILADDEHAVVVYRARGRRPDGRELDVEQALLVDVAGGLWRRARAQPLDQAAFDAFWAG